jgi:hypothetical protein
MNHPELEPMAARAREFLDCEDGRREEALEKPSAG